MHSMYIVWNGDNVYVAHHGSKAYWGKYLPLISLAARGRDINNMKGGGHEGQSNIG